MIYSLISLFLNFFSYVPGFSNFVFRVSVFRHSGVPAFRRSGVPAFRVSVQAARARFLHHPFRAAVPFTVPCIFLDIFFSLKINTSLYRDAHSASAMLSDKSKIFLTLRHRNKN